jgi:hypothetical protein
VRLAWPTAGCGGTTSAIGGDAVIALRWRHSDDLQHTWVSAEVARGRLQSWGRHSTEEEQRWQELRLAANGDPLRCSLCENSTETEGSGEEVRASKLGQRPALPIEQQGMGHTQQWWGCSARMNATSRTRVSTAALHRTPGVRCCGHLGAPFWAIYGLNWAMGLKSKLLPT